MAPAARPGGAVGEVETRFKRGVTMDFSLSDEQQLIIKTTREFVQNELYPHEKEVEESGVLRDDLHRELKAKAIDAGLYAATMRAKVGGSDLDTGQWVLSEKDLG